MIEQAKSIASEFVLPSSTDWAQLPTAPEVAKVRALVYSFRAPGTWKRLLPAWRRAKAYIQSRMAAAGEKLTAATLGSKTGRNYIVGAAYHAYESSTAISAVSSCIQAISLALAVSDEEPPSSFLLRVLRTVSNKNRSQAARKVAAITLEEAGMLNDGWGRPGQPIVHRMVAMALCLAFVRLLRFSDFALVNLAFIYWMGDKGFAFKIGRRKNDQTMIFTDWMCVADKPGPYSFVKNFRAFVRDTNPTVEIPSWGCADSSAFVFRDFGLPKTPPVGESRVSGKSWRGKSERVLTSDGSLPITCATTNAIYQKWLRWTRFALVACCPHISEADAALFGTQSCRRGGNTALWKRGVPKEMRLFAGGWRDPTSEPGYLESTLTDQIEMSRGRDGEIALSL